MFGLVLNFAMSQETKSDSSYVQFSGIVVTQDSLRPLSYCTVIDKATKRESESQQKFKNLF